MFYESDLGAKSPGLPVIKAKSGEEIRCRPHLCPTRLDIIKINTVYGCTNYSTKSDSNVGPKPVVIRVSNNETVADRNTSVSTNVSGSCSSLHWKSNIYFEVKDNPVVSSTSPSGRHFVCRAQIFNNDFKSGETDSNNSECIVTTFGLSFKWAFVKYDILINPLQVKVDWIHYDGPSNNSVTVNNKQKPDYVTKCTQVKTLLKSINHCTQRQILTC